MKAFFLVLLVVLMGCAGSKKMANSDSVPADVLNTEYVLLVQKVEGSMANHLNNMTERQMKKHYKGRFEMVSKKDIETDPKYSNLNVYRFIVKENTGSGPEYVKVDNGGPATHGPSSVSYSDQVVFDRKENKYLRPTGMQAHNHAQGMMFFAKAASKKAK